MELKFLLWFVLGVLVEAILSSVYESMISARGTLRIDHTNPEKDLYRLDIESFDNIDRKKIVTLKIDHNAHLSQD